MVLFWVCLCMLDFPGLSWASLGFAVLPWATLPASRKPCIDVLGAHECFWVSWGPSLGLFGFLKLS